MRKFLIAAGAAIFALFSFSVFTTTSANAGNPHNNQNWGKKMERPHTPHRKVYRKRPQQQSRGYRREARRGYRTEQRSTRRIVKRSRRTVRRSSGRSAAASLAAFESCMSSAGFSSGQDYRVKTKKQNVAGTTVLVGYKIQLRSYVTGNPELMGKVKVCG